MKIKIHEAVLDNLKELKEWNLIIYFNDMILMYI